MGKYFSATFFTMLLWSGWCGEAAGSDGSWTSNAAGNWSGAGYWANGTIADGAGDTAWFTNNITAARTITIDGAVASRTLGALIIGDADGSNSFTIAASGGGNLTFNNSGGAAQLNQTTFSTNNTISAPLALADPLDIDNASANLLAISGPITGGVASARTLANAGTGAGGVTISGVIGDGAGAVTLVQRSDSSLLTLGAANTYSGHSIVSNGTLKAGTANALPGGPGRGNVVVNGTLDLSGFANAVNGLSGTGMVNNSSSTARTLVVGSNGQSSVFSGIITNSGAIASLALTKTGSGTLTLSGTNGYGGLTIVTGGVLKIQSSRALGLANNGVVVAAGSALHLQGDIDVSGEAMSLNGTGSANDGALRNLSGANAYGGAITLAGHSRIQCDSGALVLGNAVSGAFGLTFGGTGEVTLCAASTYSGGTAISNGTLLVANTNGSATGTGPVTVCSNATLAGVGRITGVVTNSGGGVLAPGFDGNAGGTLTLGNLVWNGAGIYVCEVTNIANNETGAGVDYDRLVVTGALSAVALGTNLVIRLDSLGLTPAFETNRNYSLQLISCGLAATLNPAEVTLDTNAFLVPGTWMLTNLNKSIYAVCLGDVSPSKNYWIGSGNWSTATNWSMGHAPLPGEDVEFDFRNVANCAANIVSNNLGSVTLAAGYLGTVTFAANAVAGGMNLTVTNHISVMGGNLVFAGNTTVINEESGGTAGSKHGIGYTIAVTTLHVAAGGFLNADSLGFPIQGGPGRGVVYRQGGGHGGRGANYDSTYGLTYGSQTYPTALGSGGAHSSYGKPGGGALKLLVAGTATVHGAVSARGGNRENYGNQGGSGSGGSVWLECDTLAGGGDINADGGGLPGDTDGGGGGGRVRVVYRSLAGFSTNKITADGGGPPAHLGENGSVVIIDLTVPNTPPAPPSLSYPTNGATLESPYLQFSAADADSDTLMFKVEIATDAGFASIVKTIDQTASQATWYEQTELTSTRYGSGKRATVTVPPPDLNAGATYHWRVYAIDPDGSNVWSASSAEWSFTTFATPANYWLGQFLTGDHLWSNTNNWSRKAAPGPGDDVRFGGGEFFDGSCTANSVSNNLGSITLAADYPGSVTFNSNAVAGGMSLTVSNAITILSGYLSFAGDTTVINEDSGGTAGSKHGIGYTIAATTLYIAAAGSLNADSLGFGYQQGPGRGVVYKQGGGHGGHGANYDSTYGQTYGSKTYPTALGSGGAHSDYGKPGGGALKLFVPGTATVHGVISARGGNRENYGNQGGSGSGGSVWLICGTLAGSGSINADGGGLSSDTDGGGGGGRVRVAYWSLDGFDTNMITAAGGGPPAHLGEDGTVVLIDMTVPNSSPAPPTPIFPTNGAILKAPCLQFSTTDAEFDTLMYKVEIATDAGFSDIVRVLDQTASQADWYEQTEQAGTRYASEYRATVAIPPPGLNVGATYHWRVYAIDPDGSNVWSAASVAQSFTTFPTQANYWIGRWLVGNLLWSNTNNWSRRVLPAAGDHVRFGGSGGFFDGNCYVNLTNIPGPLASLTMDSDYIRTVAFSSNAVAGTGVVRMVFVVSNEITILAGNLVFAGDPTVINESSGGASTNKHGIGYTIEMDSLFIDAAGSLHADAKGFVRATGPGTGGNNLLKKGAGHGGRGSNYDATNGLTYGSTLCPTALGSGGSDVTYGGAGGGALKLLVAGGARIDGRLSAHGADHGNWLDLGGAGSGGSIILACNSIEGSGTIAANGGGPDSTGGAGGGRIMILYGGTPQMRRTILAEGTVDAKTLAVLEPSFFNTNNIAVAGGGTDTGQGEEGTRAYRMTRSVGIVITFR